MHKTGYIAIFCMLLIVMLGCFAETNKLIHALSSNVPPEHIEQLILEGEDVNFTDIEFLRRIKPVLRYALDRGIDAESVEIINLLVKAGANVNQVTYNRVQDKKLYGMMPLLTYAAIYSSAEIVQILIDAGAQDIILSDKLAFKKSALEIAQELGRMDIGALLE